jgi:hypothetical protein
MPAVFLNIDGLVMLAFKGPDITINARCYYGILQNLCTAIKGSVLESSRGMLHHHVAQQCLPPCSLHCLGLAVLHVLHLLGDFHLFIPLKKA